MPWLEKSDFISHTTGWMNYGADGKEFTVFDNSINYLNYSKISIKSLLVSSPKCSNSFSMSDDIWFINKLIRCFSSMA